MKQGPRENILAAVLLTVSALFAALPGTAQVERLPKELKEIEINRGLKEQERECIVCHYRNEPGKVTDWSHSLHARANVTCIDCHRAEKTDLDARNCPGTEKYADLMITPVVTPLDCSRCHPLEQEQFSVSKHARTWEIQTVELKDNFLKGMNNDIERATGCYACHGSDLSSGELTVMNWPNVGCGRKNPDGSLGSCVICHTSHHFNIAEARKPETCGQCHLGPDHPQNEIYFESKHGKRYLAEHAEWDFTAAPDVWEPSSHYSAPTCAVCHMSGVGALSTSHDVGERLKWEAQAPLTVMNKDHDGDKEREKMIEVCTQCHSPRWANNYLERYDLAIANYNEEYFKPVKQEMDKLYSEGLVTKWPYFDEEIEWTYYEFWHHEGRRARMGSAMMGPDYSWWHGFYDLKKSYLHFMHEAEAIRERGHGSPVYVPGSGGENMTPVEVPEMEKTWDGVEHLIGRPKK